MSPVDKAEIRVKARIKEYEQEVGIPVAGCPKLEEIFGQIYKVYLILAILGEKKFRSILPHA
jgi:hypothetical protein